MILLDSTQEKGYPRGRFSLIVLGEHYLLGFDFARPILPLLTAISLEAVMNVDVTAGGLALERFGHYLLLLASR